MILASTRSLVKQTCAQLLSWKQFWWNHNFEQSPVFAVFTHEEKHRKTLSLNMICDSLSQFFLLFAAWCSALIGLMKFWFCGLSGVGSRRHVNYPSSFAAAQLQQQLRTCCPSIPHATATSTREACILCPRQEKRKNVFWWGLQWVSHAKKEEAAEIFMSVDRKKVVG